MNSFIHTSNNYQNISKAKGQIEVTPLIPQTIALYSLYTRQHRHTHTHLYTRERERRPWIEQANGIVIRAIVPVYRRGDLRGHTHTHIHVLVNGIWSRARVLASILYIYIYTIEAMWSSFCSLSYGFPFWFLTGFFNYHCSSKYMTSLCVAIMREIFMARDWFRWWLISIVLARVWVN